ncbi:MAG: transcription termination factor NusA [Eubacteriales bacterium]|nr:transcription termination factor NusA [Faecalibacterium sp.]MDY3256290.1 transcription termination factor NusA [Eubacteriales bacterium]MDY6151133.1 transcription termination factor NusA [Eubacteriales bacterium]
MVNKDFFDAIDALEYEKHVSKEKLIESLEAGLASAYKKETGESRPVMVKLDDTKNSIKVYAYRTVVAEIVDEEKEILPEDAKKIKSSYKLGDKVLEDVTPKNFSRIAAQTAKQVIMQRLNDATRDAVYSEMSEKEGEIMTAVVRRKEGDTVYVEMTGSQLEGVLGPQDQIKGEVLNVNDVIKVYVKRVRTSAYSGTQVMVSRSSAGFVRRLFELEVPEIRSGLVQIKNIVREAGYRTKIAVYSEDSNIDAIGSCIGNKGVRVNAIVNELAGEKIDVIQWCADPLEFVARSLSPAQVKMVQINELEKSAKVIVADDKLSLAIGKQGQNARLAAKLTGWKIDVKPYSSIATVQED